MAADKLKLIEEAHDTVKRLRVSVENRKADLDAAKKLLDQAIKRRDSITDLGEAALKDQQPLFSDDSTAEANGKASKGKAKAAAAEKPAKVAKGKDTSWVGMPVKNAITIGVIVNGLETHDPPVTTLGDLMLFLKRHKFEDLPGVGAEKAAKAADQLAEFRKAHPEFSI